MNYNDGFLSRLALTADPHRQSFLFFRWSFWSLLLVSVLSAAVFYFRSDPVVAGFLRNWFVYLPNYLIHEFSHRIVGSVTFMGAHGLFGGCADLDGRVCYPIASWLTTIAGNGVECLVPLALIGLSLRLKGGRWLLPPLLYWSATTWYDAAVYVSDARASKLPLTSSDMLSNFAPGEMKGDWYYILKPLGLLEWDTAIGIVFFVIAAVLLVLAFYSLWYYWTHIDDFIREEPVRPLPVYGQARARVTAEDYVRDPFADLPPARRSAPPQDVNELYPRGPNDPPL